jgi:hypothetical protein
LTFVGLSRAWGFNLRSLQSVKESYFFALAFQFVAILVGTVFNYKLTSRFTWHKKDASEEPLDTKNPGENDLVSVENSPDRTRALREISR